MDLMKSEENLKKKQVMMKNKGKGGRGRRSSSEKNAIKVVHISTPMKVKISASQFMKTVQELTGRESDVVRIMERYGGRDTWIVLDHEHGDDHHHHLGLVPSSLMVDDGSSPSSSSEELVDHQGVLGRKQEESGPFDFNLLFDNHQFSFHFGQELGTK